MCSAWRWSRRRGDRRPGGGGLIKIGVESLARRMLLRTRGRVRAEHGAAGAYVRCRSGLLVQLRGELKNVQHGLRTARGALQRLGHQLLVASDDAQDEPLHEPAGKCLLDALGTAAGVSPLAWLERPSFTRFGTAMPEFPAGIRLIFVANESRSVEPSRPRWDFASPASRWRQTLTSMGSGARTSAHARAARPLSAV
jgi:hypothetical protein